MRTVEEHLAVCLDGVSPLPPLDLPLLDAQGCILAEDVVAPHPLPAFDQAAVDGYAVRLSDVAAASPDAPVTLPVVGDVLTGRSPAVSVQAGFTARVQAGAPVPPGTEAVVPAEWTDRGVARVRVDRASAPGTGVRRQAEDVAPGTVVLRAGERLGPGHLGLLAAVGRARVSVRPRPRAVIVSVGDELVEPGGPAGPGQVHEVSTYVLTAQAKDAGALAFRVGILGEDPRRIVDAIEDQLVRADLVVVSGGTGAHAADVVHEVLTGLGTVDRTAVALHPGSQQGFGTVGPDDTPIFTLPADPVASYVSFELFVRPVVRRMLGLEGRSRDVVRAVCQEPVVSAPGVRHLVQGRLGVEDGRYVVRPCGGPGAHRLVGVGGSNCLVVVPEATARVEAGSPVEVVVVDRLGA